MEWHSCRKLLAKHTQKTAISSFPTDNRSLALVYRFTRFHEVFFMKFICEVCLFHALTGEKLINDPKHVPAYLVFIVPKYVNE